ncbi:hypothetical protein Shell_0119 [Staphylothermus hellenicus DSM 12710]|uniref:Uncharacterized protein n=1 Tax=Staphylothermus hellenicus (strain DSM 12710 / JCM 10830 / BK20S6-10-b1 / P8) TaxID=591019 RepID=D7DAR8_STAHD|nr:hypothetical protein Shell_0119 [Staphylothermus hellenicus DSM 12710]
MELMHLIVIRVVILVNVIGVVLITVNVLRIIVAPTILMDLKLVRRNVWRKEILQIMEENPIFVTLLDGVVLKIKK